MFLSAKFSLRKLGREEENVNSPSHERTNKHMDRNRDGTAMRSVLLQRPIWTLLASLTDVAIGEAVAILDLDIILLQAVWAVLVVHWVCVHLAGALNAVTAHTGGVDASSCSMVLVAAGAVVVVLVSGLNAGCFSSGSSKDWRCDACRWCLRGRVDLDVFVWVGRHG